MLSDYVLLLTSTGKNDKTKNLMEVLLKNKMKGSRVYSSSITLFLEPNKQRFEELNKVCLGECSFSIYYVSIMEYLKRNCKYKELESFTNQLLEKLIDGDLIISDVHFPQFVFAYLGFALKQNSKKELSDFMYKKSIEGMNEKSYIYHSLINIRE